jgi:hypothetical protein
MTEQITKEGQIKTLPALLFRDNGDQVIVASLEVAAECGWVEYVAPVPTPEEIAQRIINLRLSALADIDSAAVAMDSRVTTIGGNQALEYAYRAQQIERWDLDAVKDINELYTPANSVILGQSVTAPQRYKWGLLRCYWQGMQVEYPGATVTDAINKIRYERDLWLWILDLRAEARLGAGGKPAVRMGTTEAEIIAARDAAVAFLGSIGV